MFLHMDMVIVSIMIVSGALIFMSFNNPFRCSGFPMLKYIVMTFIFMMVNSQTFQCYDVPWGYISVQCVPVGQRQVGNGVKIPFQSITGNDMSRREDSNPLHLR